MWDLFALICVTKHLKERNAARKLVALESQNSLSALPKCPTGIQGLDEITFGGLPKGRTTLVCGSAGCGKTLLGMEFLIRGATEFNEAGVCISFEETDDELINNVASLGFDVNALIAKKKLAIDHIYLERSLIEEAGDYDLEALFVRIGYAVDSIGAKRVLLDSVEALFAGLANEGVLRSELRRLFRWLKDRGLTAVVSGERGQGSLTRYGLEEYISDCVILLEHNVVDSVLTRRLRVVKYRGTTHGTNEYPFLIENDGISVLPVTSMDLTHSVSSERVSSGVPAMDEMLGGKGYFRGSSILVTGTAGTGKTSLTASFVDAACARGEKCILFSFEESPNQIIRNMRSIGMDLQRWVDKGLLLFHASRPTTFGLELHLVKIVQAFHRSGRPGYRAAALGHFHRSPKHAVAPGRFPERCGNYSFDDNADSRFRTPRKKPEIEISSLVDTWLLLRDIETGGERNRGLYILKSRGGAHSNQIREFLLTDHGIRLREVYLGEAGLLTGSARVTQEGKDSSAALLARQEIERKELLLDRKRKALDAQIAALRLELETEEQESRQLIAQEQMKLKKGEFDRTEMSRSRSAKTADPSEGNGKQVRTQGGRK